MNSHFRCYLAAVAVTSLASCYPIPDQPRNPRPSQPSAQQPPSALELQQLEEQRKRIEQEAAAREQAQIQPQPESRQPSPPPPTEPTPRSDYPFASPVPGKDGFVFSPYNNKVVDVRDIPSGTLVQDPTYPPAEKKYFRVP